MAVAKGNKNKKKNGNKIIEGDNPLMDEEAQNIWDRYGEFLKKNKKKPQMKDLIKLGISRDILQRRFGGINALHDLYREENPDNRFGKNAITWDHLYAEETRALVKERVDGTEIFLITGAVSGKKAVTKFVKAIDNFCDTNNAGFLILGSRDSGTEENFRFMDDFVMDPVLSHGHFISEDLNINNNLHLSSTCLSARVRHPLNGLQYLGHREGSRIYGGPKQQLLYSANHKGKWPPAVMMTGAVTENDYSSDYVNSQKPIMHAKKDHVIGGLIVEVVDDRIFNFRQTQAVSDGSFIDLGKRYYPNGKVVDVECDLVLGDLHAGQTCEDVMKAVRRLSKQIRIRNIIVHDLFDGYSINHHERENIIAMAEKYRDGKASLKDELQIVADALKELSELCHGRVIIVKSNHDEFIDKHIKNKKVVLDPMNLEISCDLINKTLRGEIDDLVKYSLKNYTTYKDSSKFLWLNRDSSFKVGGIELGCHGDLGSNGARGSTRSINLGCGPAVIGHSHTAKIDHDVYVVGTSSNLDLGYNRGLSSWTHTACLVYKNGIRQLLNFINGEYSIIK